MPPPEEPGLGTWVFAPTPVIVGVGGPQKPPSSSLLAAGELHPLVPLEQGPGSQLSAPAPVL